ncbi:MAG TPA: UvrD-helicase domain-containing protein [Actinocrinis sp.]|nr:UvrD-helicase domain-containing protein [Actinocrinis sp.]
MTAGLTADRVQRARDELSMMVRRSREARNLAGRYAAAMPGERLAAEALITLTAAGWRLLVAAGWPGPRPGGPDMMLVGPGGVFVLDVKNWREEPTLAGGRLAAGVEDRHAEVGRLLSHTRAVQEALGALGLSPVAVQPVLVFTDRRYDRRLGEVMLLGTRDTGPVLLALPRRLSPAQIGAITTHLTGRFPGYEAPSLADRGEQPRAGYRSIALPGPNPGPGDGSGAGPAPASGAKPTPGAMPGPGQGSERELNRRSESGYGPRYPSAAKHPAPSHPGPPPTASGPPSSLFDLEELRKATLDSALAEPIENWMTFLDPHQAALVRRTFTGPARISGPAGTGKTVVGLHRAVHLAQRTTRPILFVTYANNLPRVQHLLARRLAPAVADRIEFSSLHNFATGLLTARGIPARLNGDRAETLLSRAWQNVGRNSSLVRTEANPTYWFDEINYVVKGRQIGTVYQYLAAERRGRRTPVRVEDRRSVWALYEEYERLRAEAGIHDFNDVLALALAELRRQPLARPYAAVIADEVQDLSLVGIRLLYALVGDTTNGLLLIGDGQQAVYPGGYRLSDAGIAIAGARGVVLGTNYRNAREILDCALQVVDGDSFDDLDESTNSGERRVETVYRGGQVTRVVAPTVADHDQALINALRELLPPEPPTNEAQPPASPGTVAPDPQSGQADPAQNVPPATGRLGDAAVLCPTLREVDRYHRLLTKAGLPVQRLESYDGAATSACKLGTYHRVKGLEFKQVFLPCHDLALRDPGDSGAAAQERGQLGRRRLFVAMTRARDRVWLGSVAAGPGGGESGGAVVPIERP